MYTGSFGSHQGHCKHSFLTCTSVFCASSVQCRFAVATVSMGAEDFILDVFRSLAILIFYHNHLQNNITQWQRNAVSELTARAQS